MIMEATVQHRVAFYGPQVLRDKPTLKWECTRAHMLSHKCMQHECSLAHSHIHSWTNIQPEAEDLRLEPDHKVTLDARFFSALNPV